MAYGDKRDFRPIRILLRNPFGEWVYYCTTTWSRTCADAKAQFLRQHEADGYSPANVRATFKR